MNHSDVIVVGAGPAGCMLAGELALAGRSVLVLEKHREMSPLSRAFGVHARTLEVLDSRGLADRLLATGTHASGLKLWNGLGLDLAVLPTKYPFLLVSPQTNVDSLLASNAAAVGATFERGFTVTGIEQQHDGVVVRGRDDDNNEREWTASYVVGADGVHSIVRDSVGLKFPGHALLQSIMLADVQLSDPPNGLINVDAGKDCFAFVAPFGDGWFRVIAWERGDSADEDAPIDKARLRGVLQRAMGTDYGWSQVRWTSRFTCDERQVEQYRVGRVFLVGDAAHVHSPAGGQGMNTGIQDAMNLGWKLAAVLNGADDSVLDTYHDERHPVGKLVLRSSGATIRLLLLRSRFAKVLRNNISAFVLGRPRIAGKVAGMFSGIGISYGRRRHDNPLVGTRAAAVSVTGGTSANALRPGKFVLVVEKDCEASALLHRAEDGPAILVRPDGYIAWAGDSRTGEWQRALSLWSAATPESVTTSPAAV